MQTTFDQQTSDVLRPTVSYNNTTEAEMYPNHTLAMTLLRTVIPVIVLMGTVGNTLSFCVLVRRRMRSTPMYFYLTLLAVADTFVLYVSAFKVWIRVVTQFEVLHMSNVGCKLFMFILLCSFYMSAWLVVLVTLDRFLVVWFPFRGYLLMRIRQARLTAAALAVIVAVYNIHVFWTMSLYRFGSAPTCDAAEDNYFMMHIFEYLKLISYCVVPFVIVFALNVGILVRINRVYTNDTMRQDSGLRNTAVVYRHQSPLVLPVAGNVKNAAVRPQRQQLALSGASSTSSANYSQSPLNVQKLRQRRLTRILLFISFTWLSLTAPFTLHSFLPGPSSSTPSSALSSSSSITNFSVATLSVSTSSMVSQVVTFDKATNSTLDEIMYVYDDNLKVSKSMVASLFNLDYLHKTTTWASSTFASTSSPSVGIDPSSYLLVKIICFLLMYVNHAVNFYLYCLTGKRFRRELAAMLHCCRVPLVCRECTDDRDPAAAAAAAVVVGEMAVLSDRRNLHAHQQLAGRMPPNQAQHNSTSSRTRSGRGIRKSELVDERYS